MLNATTSTFVTPEVVQQLAADPSLRARLEMEPLETLKELGVEVQGCSLPKQVVLPTDAEFQACEEMDSTTAPFWRGFVV